MFDVKKAMDEAKKEVAEEQFNKAKDKYKSKLRELAQAEAIVANIKRELTDLELKFGNVN